jgi:hypothetical protein
MCTKIQPGKKLKSPVPQKAEDEMREWGYNQSPEHLVC